MYLLCIKLNINTKQNWAVYIWYRFKLKWKWCTITCTKYSYTTKWIISFFNKVVPAGETDSKISFRTRATDIISNMEPRVVMPEYHRLTICSCTRLYVTIICMLQYNLIKKLIRLSSVIWSTLYAVKHVRFLTLSSSLNPNGWIMNNAINF